MKKVIAISAIAMCFSVSAFAQQLVNGKKDDKKAEKPAVFEMRASYIKNEVGIPYIEKKQPGLQLEGTFTTDKTFVDGQINLLNANQGLKQPTRVFGNLSAYRAIDRKLGRQNIQLGGEVNHFPMSSKIAPAIGILQNDDPADIREYRALWALQPVGYFQSNVASSEHGGVDRNFKSAMSGLKFKARGPINSGPFEAQMNADVCMLYGGSAHTGETTSKQKGVGAFVNFGLDVGFPVSKNIALDIGYQLGFQAYKVETTNMAKNNEVSLNRFSASNMTTRVGVRVLLPGKVKGKAAQVL